MILERIPSRNIPEPARNLLWGRAAGRCEFKGCNSPLWKNPVTQETVNIAQAAHIYAFSEAGPRGNEGMTKELLNDFSNLLLTCYGCHKTIDKEKDGGAYTVKLLQKWKEDHEARVEQVTGINPSHHSHIVLYGRGIGDVDSPLKRADAAVALFPNRFPDESFATELATASSDWDERDAEFWNIEKKDLERKFERKLRNRLANGEIGHLSVFALAPMPLLIQLGTFLTDIRDVDVFQLHRSPKGWMWPSEGKQLNIGLQRPATDSGAPVLVIALSATISDDRIHQVMGDDVSIWRLTIPKPTQECIRSRADLNTFYLEVLKAMDAIKAAHGEILPLSIFPAAPVSTMVQLGLARQRKADLEWIIFDEVKELGGFVEALRL